MRRDEWFPVHDGRCADGILGLGLAYILRLDHGAAMAQDAHLKHISITWPGCRRPRRVSLRSAVPPMTLF